LKPSHAITRPSSLHFQGPLPAYDKLDKHFYGLHHVRKPDLSNFRNAASEPRWLLSLLDILDREKVSLISFVAPTVLWYPQFLQLFQNQIILGTLEMNVLRSIAQDSQNQASTTMLTLLENQRSTPEPSLDKLLVLGPCISHKQRDYRIGVFFAAMLTQEAPKLAKLSLTYLRLSQFVIACDVLTDTSQVHQPGPRPRPWPRYPSTRLSAPQLIDINLFDRSFKLYPWIDINELTSLKLINCTRS
jgi:hypothetical protein